MLGLALTRLPDPWSALGFPLTVLLVVIGSSLVRKMLPLAAVPVQENSDRMKARYASWAIAAILCAVVFVISWFDGID